MLNSATSIIAPTVGEGEARPSPGEPGRRLQRENQSCLEQRARPSNCSSFSEVVIVVSTALRTMALDW